MRATLCEYVIKHQQSVFTWPVPHSLGRGCASMNLSQQAQFKPLAFGLPLQACSVQKIGEVAALISCGVGGDSLILSGQGEDVSQVAR